MYGYYYSYCTNSLRFKLCYLQYRRYILKCSIKNMLFDYSFLSHNQLTSLHSGVFNGLVSLLHLDLSHNKFKLMAPKVFHGMTSLQHLITDEFRFCCLAPASVQCLPKPNEFSSCEDLMTNYVLRCCTVKLLYIEPSAGQKFCS